MYATAKRKTVKAINNYMFNSDSRLSVYDLILPNSICGITSICMVYTAFKMIKYSDRIELA